ncbi:MAG: type I phosphomannose isomerase catalytic subunit, partial [Bacillota bacterium]
MYPIKFKPVYKEKIWGGRNLKRLFNKNIPEGKVGESWEIASHENGKSIIKNGTYRGMTIQELIAEQGQQILGEKAVDEYYNKFPLLIKLIDARDNLSVQVHPDDQYASQYKGGESGKTELWYVLNAEPGAK